MLVLVNFIHTSPPHTPLQGLWLILAEGFEKSEISEHTLANVL